MYIHIYITAARYPWTVFVHVPSAKKAARSARSHMPRPGMSGILTVVGKASHTLKECISESCYIQPYFDCNYNFLVNVIRVYAIRLWFCVWLALNGIPFSAISIENDQSKFKFSQF